jgi:hypothetical protein
MLGGATGAVIAWDYYLKKGNAFSIPESFFSLFFSLKHRYLCPVDK